MMNKDAMIASAAFIVDLHQEGSQATSSSLAQLKCHQLAQHQELDS
jgi:hypothetical protein